MEWLVYELGPIDHNWGYLGTVIATAKAIGSDDAHQRVLGQAFPDLGIDEFMADWEAAKVAAARYGWEGDFRRDPVVFWIPDDVQFRYGFTLKQDNNGATYVVSPVELPHLRDYFRG